MIQGPILRIGVGMDLTIDCLRRKRIRKLISSLDLNMVSPVPLEAVRPSQSAQRPRLPHQGKALVDALRIYPLFPILILILNPALCVKLITVWCWGWDGAGDLDGPDVDPIWEPMPKKSYSEDSIKVKHHRDIPGIN
jgi:hypothetical protein